MFRVSLIIVSLRLTLLCYILCVYNYSVPAPSVTVTSSGQHILGEGVNLTCTAETIPEVQSTSGIEGVFVWLSNGEEVASDDVDSRFQLINQVRLLMSHLRITSLSLMDRNFTCSAAIQQRTFGRVSPRASAAFLPNFRCENINIIERAFSVAIN